MNTSLAITVLYDVLKYNTNGRTKLNCIADFDTVLSLGLIKAAEEKKAQDAEKARSAAASLAPQGVSEELKTRVEALIAERKEAKKAKNFARADEIRDSLKAEGISLIDTAEGVKWTVE